MVRNQQLLKIYIDSNLENTLVGVRTLRLPMYVLSEIRYYHHHFRD